MYARALTPRLCRLDSRRSSCPDARERAGPVFPPPPHGGEEETQAQSREIVGVLSLEILRLIGEIRNPNPSWDLVTRNLTANW